jgi:hypothetical protein
MSASEIRGHNEGRTIVIEVMRSRTSKVSANGYVCNRRRSSRWLLQKLNLLTVVLSSSAQCSDAAKDRAAQHRC